MNRRGNRFQYELRYWLIHGILTFVDWSLINEEYLLYRLKVVEHTLIRNGVFKNTRFVSNSTNLIVTRYSITVLTKFQIFQITRIINSREASANIRSPVSYIKIQLHILQQFSITDETSIIFSKKNKPPSHDIKVHAQKSKESRRYKGTSRLIEATCTES